MARIMHERVPLAVVEGGENMAEFQPDPFLTSLGMSVDQQRAYDAYCDAIVDASEAEMKRTGGYVHPRRGLRTCTRGSRAP